MRAYNIVPERRPAVRRMHEEKNFKSLTFLPATRRPMYRPSQPDRRGTENNKPIYPQSFKKGRFCSLDSRTRRYVYLGVQRCSIYCRHFGRDAGTRCLLHPPATHDEEERGKCHIQGKPENPKDLSPEVYYARKYEQALAWIYIYIRKSQPVAASLSFTASAAEY